MKTTNIRSLCLTASTLVLLAACGGGEGAAPEPASINANAAVEKAVANAIAFPRLAGTDKAGNTYGMTISQSALVRGPDNAPNGRQSITLTRNGAAFSTRSMYLYFSFDPFTLQRDTNVDTNQTRIYDKVGNLPTAAAPGAKGTLSTYTVYPSSTVNIPVGTGTTTWSIEADTVGTAFVCLNSSSQTLQPETFCYRVDASGAVTGVKATISINNELVSFK